MGNCLLNAGLTLLCLLPKCHTPVWPPVFFHIQEDLTVPRRGREAALAWASVSIRRKGKGKNSLGQEKRWNPAGRRRGEERRMMKNKANARAAATGQRSIFPFSSKALVDGGKDKGWAKEMLCLSLHWLLIYLCPILGNPRSRRLEAKASNQAVCPKRIHYLR